jgi:hypothetical protein
MKTFRLALPRHAGQPLPYIPSFATFCRQ